MINKIKWKSRNNCKRKTKLMGTQIIMKGNKKKMRNLFLVIKNKKKLTREEINKISNKNICRKKKKHNLQRIKLRLTKMINRFKRLILILRSNNKLNSLMTILYFYSNKILVLTNRNKLKRIRNSSPTMKMKQKSKKAPNSKIMLKKIQIKTQNLTVIALSLFRTRILMIRAKQTLKERSMDKIKQVVSITMIGIVSSSNKLTPKARAKRQQSSQATETFTRISYCSTDNSSNSNSRSSSSNRFNNSNSCSKILNREVKKDNSKRV